jgi:hypothetical protein
MSPAAWLPDFDVDRHEGQAQHNRAKALEHGALCNQAHKPGQAQLADEVQTPAG